MEQRRAVWKPYDGHTRPVTVVADLWGDAHGPGRRAVLVDVAVGATFAVLVGFIQLQLLSWTWPAAVLLGVALAVRRVAPLLMVAVAVLASIAQLVSGHVAFVACTAYVPLFATLGAHRDARLRRLGLASGVVAVVVASAWAWSQSDQDATSGRVTSTVALGAPTAVLVLGGWAIGYLRWQRRQAVQARADATVQSVERRRLSDLYEQEQERGRIAADMHDLVAHSWAVVAAQADGARYVVRDDPDRAQDALSVIGDTARSAMDDVRVLLARLREPGGADEMAVERPDALEARMRSAGMDLRIAKHGEPVAGSLLERTAQRVLTESLTNALKHGDLAHPVEVVEDWRDGYRLRVSNAVGDHDGGDGHGLVGMRERMALVGGTLTAGRRGDHWVVEAGLS